MTKLTHIDEQGAARMADVSGKETTEREATAEAVIVLSAEAFDDFGNPFLLFLIGVAWRTGRLSGVQSLAEAQPELGPAFANVFFVLAVRFLNRPAQDLPNDRGINQ